MFISLIRTVILYVFIIVALRLMGKRQISDMQPSELVVTMVISDIASLPMQNTSQPLLSGVIPVMVLAALEIATSVIMLKSRGFRKMICGSPVVVIEDGRLLQDQMKRLRMTTDELCAQLRGQNVFNIDDVSYCIVETNGTLSVLEKPQKTAPAAEDFGIEVQDKKPDSIIISDGEVLRSSPQLTKVSKSELRKILKKNNIRLADVFLMTASGQDYTIIKKE